MILDAALALLLVSAPPATLDEARRAFAAEDYASAERLALVAAADDPAPALYLVGLARFRDGRPAEALEALERAEAGADSPATWRFNRGACLFELRRYAEAEAAFLEAAADPHLEALALVNAGFAALEGGSAARARALAVRARAAAADPAAVSLVEELEEALEPLPGGDEPARTPDATRGAPADAAASWTVWGRADAGWDDDATRAAVGAVERPGVVSSVESGFAMSTVGAELTVPVGSATVAIDYGGQQLAFRAAAAEDYSVQQHDVVAALRTRRGEALVLEAAVFGEYALAGLSNLRGMQAAAGLRLAEAIQWADRQTTRVVLSGTAKDGQGSEFAALDGSRLEVAASHEMGFGPVLAVAGYRFQLERIGDAITPVPAGAFECPLGCTASQVQPLSYVAHAGSLALRSEPRPWLRVDVAGGVEGRWALDEIRVVLTGPDGVRIAGQRRRTDLRGFGSETVAARLAPGLSLVLRHDWLLNRTRLEPSGSASGRRVSTVDWDKHVLTAGLAAEW